MYYISGIRSSFYLPVFFEMSHDSVLLSLPPRYLRSLRMRFEIVMLTPAQIDLCVFMKLDLERRRGMFAVLYMYTEVSFSAHTHTHMT